MFFRRSLLLVVYKLSDLLILIFSLFLALFFGGYSNEPLDVFALLGARATVTEFAVIAVALLSWHVFFRLTGLYETKRFGKRLDECIDIVKATSLGACIITCIAGFFFDLLLNSYFVVAFWASASLLTILSRMAMRLVLTALRHRDRNLRHIVVVGTNARAVNFANKIRAHKEMGYKVLGFVDRENVSASDQVGIISGFDNFSEILDRYVVDEVVITLPIQSFYAEISNILELCEEQGVKVRFIMGMLFSSSHAKLDIEYMDGVPLLTLFRGPRDDFRLRLKRLFDLVLTIPALILLAPLFVVVAILVRIDSPGPVFFVQERVGYNKRLFPFYKFRTMAVDAEKRQIELEHLNEVSGPVFKIKDDPRVTKIGRFLRKTSLDELPQLFNVLKGDMSLVGPRPLPIRDYKRFEQDWQKRRFSVRPGITCLWQIQGRSGLPFDKWIELDMEYIDHWSLFLDAKILLHTIPSVMRGTGAM